MRVQRKVSATTIVEAEGATVTEVFEAIARLEAVFCGHETCGACKSTGIRYSVQEDKQDNKYYKTVCLACGCEFRFGVKRSPPGVLFPQLKDAQGNWKPNGGWVKWKSQEQSSSSQSNQGDAYEPPAF